MVGCVQYGNNFTLGWITFKRRVGNPFQPTKEAYEALLETLTEIEPFQSRGTTSV